LKDVFELYLNIAYNNIFNKVFLKTKNKNRNFSEVSEMKVEVIWLGRGGQGAVTASRILAKAFLIENKFCQSIVFFGAERRGAPVRAFNRISDHQIKEHHFVYKADAMVIFDENLIEQTTDIKNLKEGGTLVINAIDDPRKRFPFLKRYKVAYVNATQIALDLNLKIAGFAVINTAMLGAISKALGMPNIESIKKAIEDYWPDARGVANAKAAQRAYDELKIVE